MNNDSVIIEPKSKILDISHVSMSYANGNVKAVDDLSFSLEHGEIFGFLGANGAGKTTTIKMVTGILPVKSGSIKICGHDITSDAIEAKRHFGFVPDSPIIFDKYTGREYINFLGDIYGIDKAVRESITADLLERFSLRDAFDKRISGYSHGMKQKIAIIGSLIHSPELWILDEPMMGLDPQSSFALKELMKKHKSEGKTVFFSTHVLDVAEKICDRVAIIGKGKLVLCGDMEQLKRAKGDESLEEIFLSVAGEAHE
ncbi:MAG: ABC transporter ATP-binding protein [Clostridiales bacterium]|nr:ABC transporter ATP-binding protein [Clostridiales bacterium]